MTRKSLSTLLLSVALLSASCAAIQAQQQVSPDAPPPQGTPNSPDAPPPPPRGPRVLQQQKMGHDVRIISRGDDMRPGSRIAPGGMWWKNPEIVQKLALTDEQQKKMDGIFQQSRLQLIDVKADLERQELILEPMLDANPPDTNKVLAQIDHIAHARAELEKANARMLLGIRGVLTADQWTKLQASEHGDRHFMIHKGPGAPGGPESMMGGPREFHFSTPDGGEQSIQIETNR
jgi:Spy/CpxP family protein refolding chaperone